MAEQGGLDRVDVRLKKHLTMLGGVVLVAWLCSSWVAHGGHGIRVTRVMSLVYRTSSGPLRSRWLLGAEVP